MNKTDRERMRINKRALIEGLKSRKDFLERNLFETMELIEARPTQKLVAQKKVLLQSIAETKARIKEVEKPDFDGKCKECRKPIPIKYLQDHILTDVCDFCNRKKRKMELRN
ncbi:MAG TPA: hypothetical protein P5548_04465 [Candidatus Moranbacteria bacterium]|nr:hypothetical protein [Candidatus Moranbacteria bacterium]HRZ34120.1 hypothetical protein [Candidatus Moranbacteria bacterium]